MSEEQLKAAETEATAQVEEKDLEGFEEISEEDLAGVAGGAEGYYVYAPTTIRTVT